MDINPPISGFARQSVVLQHVAFSAATLWRKVKDGSFPAPVKLSANITAWHWSDVIAWADSQRTVSNFAVLPNAPAPVALAAPVERGLRHGSTGRAARAKGATPC